MSRHVGEKPQDVTIVQFQSHAPDLKHGWLSPLSVAMYGLGSDGNVYVWSIEFGYWMLATSNLTAKFALEPKPADSPDANPLTGPSSPKEND